ncbi:hypothetical protein [Caloramator sp. Dgby_cultured_2]|uniref:hypothetical protein n=1 Tax=Caloramator sp. Dgby_cultured_2 TaxID=3029174 RepID=UPI00237E4A6D|nr:hypothetical protein [Caloramator sp. Dgby_cultured_2]WDU84336.1 hypothetical protein PWK10_08705 [Caloramator sp. Dgby_cultured_2]
MRSCKNCLLRGHEVTLFEKGDKLGGQLLAGSTMKIKHDVARYIENLNYQMNLLKEKGLDIRLNTEVKIEDLRDKYDVIICANGIKPFIPKIEGLERIRYIEARELLMKGMAIPHDVKRLQ